MENVYEKKEGLLYELYRLEADEMWTFIGEKENKQWLWAIRRCDSDEHYK